MLNDVGFAREYFDLELEDMVSKGLHDAEPCGLGKNFVRVPMDLVKDGLITEEEYFAAFLESSKDFKSPDLVFWMERWGFIESVIAKMDLQLPDYKRDAKTISKLLEMGEPVVHHSDRFTMAYDPHYRIMSISVWEKLRAKSKPITGNNHQ